MKTVHPAPGISRALMSPPSPMELNPRSISQKPRKMGSVAAERDVEDQDDAEDDLDDASGHHPAAAGDEMAVGRREHHFEDARDQHQPAEDERHAQIALGRVDEGQHADCEQRDADDQQQPPVADGLLRVFDQCGEILHGIWICRFPSKLRTKPDGSPRLSPAGLRLKSGG